MNERYNNSLFPPESNSIVNRPSKRIGTAVHREVSEPLRSNTLNPSTILSKNNINYLNIDNSFLQKYKNLNKSFWPVNNLIDKIDIYPEEINKNIYMFYLFSDIFIKPMIFKNINYVSSVELISRTIIQPASKDYIAKINNSSEDYFNSVYYWNVHWLPTKNCDLKIKDAGLNNKCFFVFDTDLKFDLNNLEIIKVPFIINKKSYESPVIIKRGTPIFKMEFI